MSTIYAWLFDIALLAAAFALLLHAAAWVVLWHTRERRMRRIAAELEDWRAFRDGGRR